MDIYGSFMFTSSPYWVPGIATICPLRAPQRPASETPIRGAVVVACVYPATPGLGDGSSKRHAMDNKRRPPNAQNLGTCQLGLFRYRI